MGGISTGCNIDVGTVNGGAVRTGTVVGVDVCRAVAVGGATVGGTDSEVGVDGNGAEVDSSVTVAVDGGSGVDIAVGGGTIAGTDTEVGVDGNDAETTADSCLTSLGIVEGPVGMVLGDGVGCSDDIDMAGRSSDLSFIFRNAS